MMGEIEIPPNFKTSLPPRKRAKTKEEKEQRRIERILRNRKAAHASREKKRKHVEFLESYVLDLEKQLHLHKDLSGKLLTTYEGGNSQIDELVKQTESLPDLLEKKNQHNFEDSLEVGVELPKTPESFVSSPKSNNNFEDDVDSRSSSVSGPSAQIFVNDYISPESSPGFSNRYSLDIITGDGSDKYNSQIKTEVAEDSTFISSDKYMPQIKIEDTDGSAFLTNDPFIEPLNQETVPEKLSFDEFQVNTNDTDFGFDELRNPAVITRRPRFLLCPTVSKLGSFDRKDVAMIHRFSYSTLARCAIKSI